MESVQETILDFAPRRQASGDVMVLLVSLVDSMLPSQVSEVLCKYIGICKELSVHRQLRVEEQAAVLLNRWFQVRWNVLTPDFQM